MPIDIDHFRVEKGTWLLKANSFSGGDPEKVRASQKARFANEQVVDEVIRLDNEFKKGKLIWSVWYTRSDIWFQPNSKWNHSRNRKTTFPALLLKKRKTLKAKTNVKKKLPSPRRLMARLRSSKPQETSWKKI